MSKWESFFIFSAELDFILAIYVNSKKTRLIKPGLLVRLYINRTSKHYPDYRIVYIFLHIMQQFLLFPLGFLGVGWCCSLLFISYIYRCARLPLSLSSLIGPRTYIYTYLYTYSFLYIFFLKNIAISIVSSTFFLSKMLFLFVHF